MTAPQTLLQLLRTKTIVDCDTMDVEVPKALGPFLDCTSNQAIAYNELTKAIHKLLIQESVKAAMELHSSYPEISEKELAGEIAMIKLQLQIAPYITGFVHIQTNPVHSHNTENTITNAKRIIALFQIISPNFDSKRVCIKIPSTWAGLQACRVLENEFKITTLATTVFVIEQAALAGEVGCHYIAPYVNELRVHFDSTFVDTNKAQKLCLGAQRYYEKYGYKTQVLPASLTSTDEIMELAGVNHITISPGLLAQLDTKNAEGNGVVSLFEKAPEGFEVAEKLIFKDDEAGYKKAFEASIGGKAIEKLNDAIKIFSEMQFKMEALMVPVIS